jgi:acetylcholinesterase/carboxylesterase 2
MYLTIAGSGSLQANIKTFFNNPGRPAPEESEDCLYLNVYSPRGASPTSNKPVLVYIFGVRVPCPRSASGSDVDKGNLQFGTGGVDYYNGSILAANEDVLVVTFNYRTNSESLFDQSFFSENNSRLQSSASQTLLRFHSARRTLVS